MTEQQLFSKQTFIELFKLNELDRIERENELYLVAESYGKEKRFEKVLKDYKKIFDDKISINDYEIPKCKNYEIEKYDYGEFVVDKTGIYLQTGKNKTTKILNEIIIPVERYINKDNQKEKIKIIFYQSKRWKELVVDRNRLSSNTKLLSLSDYGLNVNSVNANNYIKFFETVLILNEDKIKTLFSVGHIGWDNNLFIPYDDQAIFDGVETGKQFYNALKSKGDYNKWYDVVSTLRKNKANKMIMASTFASPLIEKLDIGSFIVNVWSQKSGSGKTLLCMVAMSIWGDPKTLTLSTNNTYNFYVTIASFLNNITCFFDELQIIKGSKNVGFKYEDLIMTLCNGTEKGRLTKDSDSKEIKRWKNNFLFTNNDRMVAENDGEQMYNRVIDLEVNDQLFDYNPREIAQIIKDNYGFAGETYIKYIQQIGFDKIEELYEKYCQNILEKIPTSGKLSNSLACMLTADYIACKAIFTNEQPLTVQDIIDFDFIENKEEKTTAHKAYVYIVDIISANQKKFNNDNFNEFWGVIEDDGNTIKINKQILCRELNKGGFDFNSVKKEWSNKKILIKNNRYGFQHFLYVNGMPGYYVILTRNS